MTMEGLLPVNKPADFTSHDVVAKMRGILGTKRIGHTGTLDPQVTGVLPLCIGRATRLVEYLQELPKEYEGTLLLGYSTDTEDTSGQVLERVETVNVTEEQVLDVLAAFVGKIEQVPPMYSAVKVDGRKLYELARRGEQVERQARTVTIHHIEALRMDLKQPHPEIHFRVSCSKGTYIRTLCVDIGKRLGFPAVMDHLIRTATGNIKLEQCYSLEDIEKTVKSGELASILIPLDQAVGHLPAITVSSELAVRMQQGQKISFRELPDQPASWQSNVRIYVDNHRFLGIFRIDVERQCVVPVKVFD